MSQQPPLPTLTSWRQLSDLDFGQAGKWALALPGGPNGAILCDGRVVTVRVNGERCRDCYSREALLAYLEGLATHRFTYPGPRGLHSRMDSIDGGGVSKAHWGGNWSSQATTRMRNVQRRRCR